MFLAGDRFVDVHDVKISHVSDWMVVVILGRELFVTSLRGMTESGGQSFGANVYGKTKMVLQSVTVGWLLFTLGNPALFAPVAFITPYIVYGMVTITVLSAIPYLRMGKGILSEMAVKPK
jgi:CDP-diacylglycerol--glycerol-3-phosphate 3-phosphatidyltransferase